MKALKYLLFTFLTLLLLFGLFLLFSTIDDYKPDQTEILIQTENTAAISDSVFTIVTWNIGYAGLDSSMDFFYDGGKQVRPDKETVKANLRGILLQLDQFKDKDFILLQEVDKVSKRSYRSDIFNVISKMFRDRTNSFGKNYDVAFVPLPPKAPMGKVVSGLQTISQPQPAEVTRNSFPGNYAWPMSLFMLDRCFMINRYPLSNGKELLIINTHNSAYDDGSLRQEQMNFLSSLLLNEYAAGNYIVVGGDWNQSPNGFIPQFENDLFDEEDLVYIEKDYPEPGWKWAYDPTTPTNRRVKTPYIQGECLTTLIDYFLLSPNLEPLNVNGIASGFKYSDHQAVELTFKIL